MEIKEYEYIAGVKIIKTNIFEDFRGQYKKVYEANEFANSGITQFFTETSEIVSNRGVLRGLHYQRKHSQAKLVHVIKGKIYDVAVDLRPDSSTFGKWCGFFLEEGDNTSILIPEDFAHGFLVLEDNTVFSYQCSGKYDPDSCGGIRWDDKSLAIEWPELDSKKIILSEKDRISNISVAEYRRRFCDDRKDCI